MDTEEIIATSSAVIAFSAFITAVYSSYETRKYNRISLSPVLDGSLIFNNTAERIGLFIENKGTGPAVIDKWEMLVDGKHYRDHGIERFEDLTTFLELGERVNYGYFKPGSLLLQGQPIELFAVDSSPYSIERSNKIREALKRLTINIKYNSLYKEKKTENFIFEGSEYFKKNFGDA